MKYEVKSTWLYIKQHRITKLKYFGCTTKYRARNYDGSGTYWSAHIKKHNRKYVETLLLIGPYTNREELINLATWMSEKMDIVTSKDWANLIPEDGMALGNAKGYKHTPEAIIKMSLAKKGIPSGRKGLKLEDFCANPEECRDKQSLAKKGIKQTLEVIEKRASKIRGRPRLDMIGKEPPTKGMTYVEFYGEDKAMEIGNKISVANTGKTSEKKGKTNVELYGEDKAMEISNNISNSRKGISTGPSPFKGIPNPVHSERMKGKIPWNKGKKMDKPCIVNITKCPHCNKEGRACNMTRYHFDKCKQNPDNINSIIKLN